MAATVSARLRVARSQTARRGAPLVRRIPVERTVVDAREKWIPQRAGYRVTSESQARGSYLFVDLPKYVEHVNPDDGRRYAPSPIPSDPYARPVDSVHDETTWTWEVRC